MKEFLKFLENNLFLSKSIWSIIWLIITMVVTKVVNNTLHNLIEDTNKFYNARKFTYYVMTFFYIFILIFIWFDVAGSFTTYIGLLSAGIAVALKDLFSNIAGWFFIIIRRPFKVGDRILIHGQRGDVIDVRLFQFSLIEVNSPEDGEQSTGCIVDIPNHYIFLYPVVNAVKGFEYIWNEIKIEVTFESNWKEAKTEFEKIVNKHTLHFTDEAEEKVRQASRKFMIYYNTFTPIVYTDVSESGVILTIRYLCAPKDKRTTKNDIWEELLDYINSREDIELAYPTRRVVNKKIQYYTGFF